MVNILLFAGLAEAAGKSSIELPITLPAKVSELKSVLAETVPGTEKLLGTCFAAINHEYADDEALVHEGDELALIPPVSGG